MSYSKEELISQINEVGEQIDQIEEQIAVLESDKSYLLVKLSDLESHLNNISDLDDEEDIYDQELW